MPLEIVNEESTAYLTVQFKDKDGNLAAPSSASYRIDCLTNGQEVRGDTALTPASSIEITLTDTDYAIIDQTNSVERRLVTIMASYGAGDDINDEYEHDLKNLRKKT